MLLKKPKEDYQYRNQKTKIREVGCFPTATLNVFYIRIKEWND